MYSILSFLRPLIICLSKDFSSSSSIAFERDSIGILCSTCLKLDKGLAPTLCVGLFFNIRFGYSSSKDSNFLTKTSYS